MKTDQLTYIIHCLKAEGVRVEAGLTDEEVSQVEQTFNLRFPPDLRAFLQAVLPVSDGFVPWRWGIQSAHRAQRLAKQRLQWSIDGLVHDAQDGNFWPVEWGGRPAGRWQREQAARQQLASCPPLIPIYGHRYLPAQPCEAGNPVFSVWGSDIIYYGYDLFSYFLHEFTLRCPPGSPVPHEPKRIAFWSNFDEPNPDVQWGYWEGEASGGLEDGDAL